MKIAIVTLASLSPYTQSRFHCTPKEDKEAADAYEQRTWIEKGHFEDGEMSIPPMAMKKCLESAAAEIAMQIPGRGKKTYKSAFKNGILIPGPIKIGMKKKDVAPTWIHANADGVPGSGKRVLRAFPTAPKWKATFEVQIINNSITEEVFRKHLEEAGQYIGIGQFRPQNGGINGRFSVVKIEFQD